MHTLILLTRKIIIFEDSEDFFMKCIFKINLILEMISKMFHILLSNHHFSIALVFKSDQRFFSKWNMHTFLKIHHMFTNICF